MESEDPTTQLYESMYTVSTSIFIGDAVPPSKTFHADRARFSAREFVKWTQKPKNNLAQFNCKRIEIIYMKSDCTLKIILTSFKFS